LNKDAFGHQQLGGVAPALASMIKQSTGYKYHWALADYLQRSARHLASKTDVDQAYAVGRRAVELALQGQSAVMVSIERSEGDTYDWCLGEAPLAKVANMEKKMPRSFITKDGFGITKKARDYLQPLIAGEDHPPYKNGLPDYVKLQNKMARKKLRTGFKT
jgi:6-phosphofructokinase 1